MENISLRSIKRESIKAIFNAIASAEQISRAEISGITGLSLMTVGKVADALINLDIISQSKEVKAAAGRKAGLVKINSGNYFLVIDITSRDFVMTVISMKLERVDKLVYTYNSDFYYEENLYIFLKNVRMYLERRFQSENCIGVGVSLPGPYDADEDTAVSSRFPELSKIKIRALIYDVLKCDSIYIDAFENVAAISNITRIPDSKEQNILYYFIGDHVGGAVVIRGEIVHGMHYGAGSFGSIPVSGGKRLEEVLTGAVELEAAAAYIAEALATAIFMLDPHVIILECERFKNNEELVGLIKKELIETYKLPESKLPLLMTGGCKFRHSHRGLALKLREKWLDSIISCQI